MKSIFLAVATMVISGMGLTASPPSHATEPAVLHVMVVQTPDVPAYVREIQALQALYEKQGLAVKTDAYKVAYAGPVVDVVVVEVVAANLAEFARVIEMSRTQPDLVAEMKKIGGMQKVLFNGLSEKLTP